MILSRVITDRDMREQVTDALAPHQEDYNVDGIASDIKDRVGLVDINMVPAAQLWSIVRGRLND